MTSEHRDALRKAIAAQQAHQQAVAEHAAKLAAERENQPQPDVAVHPASDSAGEQKET